MKTQQQATTTHKVVTSTLVDHKEMTKRVIGHLNSAPRKQLVAVISGLAETLVQHIADCHDEETRIVTAIAMIDDAFSSSDSQETAYIN
ncbi:hypothetical protein [Desulfogranum marinum]|uniref:hypothetical protein n=1 Tax=Desulfogranum marinum TaxID=453220 RepID=UPI001966210A|nr:hypothetical protein [Desulfogranum marinum]MBM9515041.1 hypothetical protein [Desulfogranum marinum]